MCGIAGIVYPDIFQMTHLIGSMVAPIPKTPTTQVDYYTIRNIEFALVGNTFATNEQKTLILGFDGTLSNALELKQTHAFLDDTSFAHTALSLYHHLGPSFVKHLQGEFIIALYNVQSQELLLARDQVGKKNVYWAQSNNHFLFSTSLKSLLVTGLVPQTMAKDAIAAYLYLGYLPQDLTPIKNVNKLLSANTLTLQESGALLIESYWSLAPHFYKPTLKGEEALFTFKEKLDLAVKKNLPPKNSPIGCFISGGLGSASIAYALSKNESHLSGYSAIFEEETEQDLTAAAKITQILNIPHFTKKISPETFLNNLIPAIWHIEEPIADPNIVATYELALLARDRTPIVFSGMGSDELLAAHNRYTVDEIHLGAKEQLKHTFAPFMKSVLIPLFKQVYKPLAYKMIKSSKIDPWQYQYLEHNTLFNRQDLSKLAPELTHLFDPEIFLNRFEDLASFPSKISSYLYIDLKTRLIDAYILQYSKLCAAQGLQWRTPYLDLPLVEFLVSLHEPNNRNEKETRYFLKKMLETVYPKDIIERPKIARTTLLDSWLKNENIKNTLDLLKKGTLVESGIISRDSIEGLKLSKNPFKSLLSILILEIWARLFITQSLSEFHQESSPFDLLK